MKLYIDPTTRKFAARIGKWLLYICKVPYRLLNALFHAVRQRENVGVLARIFITIVLIAYSAPPLLAIFKHTDDWAGVGAYFEASADCQLQFNLRDEINLRDDEAANGSVDVRWKGDDGLCTKMEIVVPGLIKTVQSFKMRATNDNSKLELEYIYSDGQADTPGITLANDVTIRIDPRILNTTVYNPRIDSDSHGLIRINFDEIRNFIRPISYTKSVTNLLARSYNLLKPGESPEERLKNPILMSAPTLKSKILLPARFTVSQAFLSNPQVVSLDRGESELTGDGGGSVYLDDLDHSEHKDLIILVDGILLATGLAMLADLLCRAADYLAGEKRV